MNQINHFIFAIYHYSLMIRDTLEYTLNRDQHNKQAYEQRKNVLLSMLDQPSPLRQFLDQNKETGEKIDRQLREFIDDLYSEHSTIVRVSGEELRVDKAQHLAVYNYIVGLHETLTDIIHGYMKFSESKGALESQFVKMIDDDERLYRSITHMAIFDDVEKTFIEFNQAMHENKGQPSPASNFIVNDLRRYVGFLKFVHQHNRIQDKELVAMMEEVDQVFTYMEGKEKIPEGLTFQKVFENAKATIRGLVSKYEQQWKQSFTTVYREVAAFERERAQKEEKNTSNMN